MTVKTRYKVVALNRAGRYVVWDCGHKHGTLSGAVRCLYEHRNNTYRRSTRIMHTDETELTEAEQVEMEKLKVNRRYTWT